MRFNPLCGEWILISPHRTQRPWSGQMEASASENIPPFDPNNPLCPNVQRSSGLVTPAYESTYVFVNDFPALLENVPEPPPSDDPLFQTAPARGTCKVICFHPKSNIYLPSMTLDEVQAVIKEWIKQTKELGEKFRWVQIFENRGSMMGCSNPHPHCQIWASDFIPNIPRIKDQNQKEYYEKYKRPLLQDYTKKELEKGERVVYENQEWVVVVPYWATWPFETMVLPKRQIERFVDCNEEQIGSLAEALQVLVSKYDNLFKCSFPYSMGWHGAPTGALWNVAQPHWTFHGIYCPPLLRSASIKKFMVGYELLAQSQRDLTAEKAAELLRAQSNHHYNLKKN